MQEKKRLVVKIGSSTLTDSESSIDAGYLDRIALQVERLMSSGWQVVIVSSGAIACGLGKLGIDTRPKDMPSLQAAASVGQSELAAAYESAFEPHCIVTSTVLLTRRDTEDRGAYLHARDTFDRLLELGVVPVVNENDTVSVEQIRFGDNDSLAALVACLIEAALLVIVSDVDGLYDANPNSCEGARLISSVECIDRTIFSVAGDAGSVVGSGGMLTKVQAARVLMAAGIPMAIVGGKIEDAIVLTVDGRCPGTMFSSPVKKHTITPKKLWIALANSAKGSIAVDDGAACALSSKGSSLLSVGVRDVDGVFDEGDIIDIKDSTGFVIARGKVLASSDEISLAIGRSRGELRENRLLAYLADTPIVHRDELMVFE